MQVSQAGAAGGMRLTPAQCAKEIYRERGLTKGLFFGLKPTLVRETVSKLCTLKNDLLRASV
jgi:hypothetical protein